MFANFTNSSRRPSSKGQGHQNRKQNQPITSKERPKNKLRRAAATTTVVTAPPESNRKQEAVKNLVKGEAARRWAKLRRKSVTAVKFTAAVQQDVAARRIRHEFASL